jgi:cobalamin biosynthesis Mg chelatase CobN
MMTMVQNESHARISGSRTAPGSADDTRTAGTQPSRERDREREQSPSGASAASKSKGKTKRRSRFTAWWFARKVIVLAMFVGALVGGLYLGFVVFGKGSMDDAFDIASYKHIYDLVFADS